MAAGGYLYVLPQLLRILDLGDLEEVLVVGDAHGPHVVLVSPLPEVPLELSATSVHVVAAYLAVELLHRFFHSAHKYLLS